MPVTVLCFISLKLILHLCKGGDTIVIAILQMRELRHRKAEKFAQHSGSKVLTPYCLTSEVLSHYTMLPPGIKKDWATGGR